MRSSEKKQIKASGKTEIGRAKSAVLNLLLKNCIRVGKKKGPRHPFGTHPQEKEGPKGGCV